MALTLGSTIRQVTGQPGSPQEGPLAFEWPAVFYTLYLGKRPMRTGVQAASGPRELGGLLTNLPSLGWGPKRESWAEPRQLLPFQPWPFKGKARQPLPRASQYRCLVPVGASTTLGYALKIPFHDSSLNEFQQPLEHTRRGDVQRLVPLP